MNYEKKYNTLLEMAKKELQELKNKDCDDITRKTAITIIYNLFPELKESEDEKIRKSIIAILDNYIDNDNTIKPAIMNWLEKQGEQKQVNPFRDVKLKFKKNDWVVLTVGELSTTLQIVNIDINKKWYWFNDGSYLSIVSIEDEECLHLWTIQDAKDGDVLASEDKDKIFLYNGKLDLKGRACAYCGIYKTYDGLRFTKCAVGNYFTYKEPHPATKEQRDLLFEKMKEAGYKWDSEKKCLTKI